ncbi:hypothetical protein [Algoriphagus machipongonensis]|nr:hypothetical protein [Algoriphagus machipongonensis]
MSQKLLPSLIILSIILGVSCSSKESVKTEENYSLVKVDSFQVDNFTRIAIRDYSPEENIYLGYASVEDDILEISATGKILKRVNKKGDGPGKYGNWNPMALAFGPNGQRIVELPFQVVAYDSDFNPVHSQNIMSPLPIRTNLPLGKTPYYQSEDSTFLLVGPSNYLTASHLIRDQEGKDTLQNFYKLHLQTGAAEMVIPYDENSIYSQSNNLYAGLMGKSFFIDHKSHELALIQDLDPQILIYSLPDLNFKESIPVEYSEFKVQNPVPIGTGFDNPQVTNLSRLSARNQNLLNFGDGLYLLQYFTGISDAEYESRTSEDAPYFGTQDASEKRILIFKDGKQLPMELPGISGALVTTLPDKKLLVQEPENTETEEEFTRFSIYQLQTN